jgi:predicted small secreted protein
VGRSITFAGLAMALVLSIFWTGCSDTTSGGGQDARNNEKIVRYSYDCENLTCYDASNIIDDTSNTSRTRTCIWNCGTGFEQCVRAQVTLKFEKIGAGCWKLTHDQLSGNYQGVCN